MTDETRRADEMRGALEILVEYYTLDDGEGWFVIRGDVPAYEWREDLKELQPAWAIVREHIGFKTPPEEAS